MISTMDLICAQYTSRHRQGQRFLIFHSELYLVRLWLAHRSFACVIVHCAGVMATSTSVPVMSIGHNDGSQSTTEFPVPSREQVLYNEASGKPSWAPSNR